MTQISFILTFITLAILTACNSSDKKFKLRTDSILENKFEQLTNKVITDTTTIVFRLDTLTNFSWDTVIILTPYYPIDKLEQKMKIDLTEIKNTKIVSDEISNVLAFVKDGQLINYVDLPRDKGDFSDITDSNRVFTKDNCLFELVRTDNKFVSGQTIIKVKPINNKITYTVTFEYMQDCDIGNSDCKPVTLSRQSINDSIIVIFPSGGTQTDIYLYTLDDFKKWMNGTPKDEPKPLRHDQKFTDQGNPSLDLTGLPDGKYRPNMLACGLGGGFDLIITTKTK